MQRLGNGSETRSRPAEACGPACTWRCGETRQRSIWVLLGSYYVVLSKMRANLLVFTVPSKRVMFSCRPLLAEGDLLADTQGPRHAVSPQHPMTLALPSAPDLPGQRHGRPAGFRSRLSCAGSRTHDRPVACVCSPTSTGTSAK